MTKSKYFTAFFLILTRRKKLIQSTYRSWTYLNKRPATCNCPRCLYSAKAIMKLYLFVVLASFLLLGFSQARKYLKVITCNKIDPMKTCLYSIIIVLAFFSFRIFVPGAIVWVFCYFLVSVWCVQEKKKFGMNMSNYNRDILSYIRFWFYTSTVKW